MEFFTSQTDSTNVTIPFLKHTELRLFQQPGAAASASRRIEFAFGHNVINELTLHRHLITESNILTALAELYDVDCRIQKQNEHNTRFIYECSFTA
jgi:hypothetical protein